MDKIKKLGQILEQYKQGKKYSECLALIDQMENDKFNYEILCQVFDEAIQNLKVFYIESGKKYPYKIKLQSGRAYNKSRSINAQDRSQVLSKC